nr:hypothetical protein [Corallococcus coralloides]
MSTASIATTVSADRSRHSATVTSGPTPNDRRCHASWLTRVLSCRKDNVAPPNTSASASGVSAACRSKLACSVASRSKSVAPPVPVRSSQSRSPADSSDTSSIRASGWISSSSACRHWASTRSTASASKRPAS